METWGGSDGSNGTHDTSYANGWYWDTTVIPGDPMLEEIVDPDTGETRYEQKLSLIHI